MSKTLAIATAVLISTGCGTVLQGKTQRVSVTTSPPGAEITVDRQRATSPATIEVERKPYTVFRASAPGYYDACQVVLAERRGGLLAMDIIFLAVPLLIDAAGGMNQLRRMPAEITLPMVKATDGEANEPLPDDATLIEAFKEETNLCAPAAITRGTRELVMTTGDISVPYSILGAVRVQAEGKQRARAARPAWWGNPFRAGGLPAVEPEHQYVAALLQDQAILQYGDKVDALINVSYHGDASSGDVSAEGLAVRFKERPIATP